MLSNQIIQKTVDEISSITNVELCVMDVETNYFAATVDEMESYRETAKKFVDSEADSQIIDGCQFFKVEYDGVMNYVVILKGESEEVYTIGKMLVFQLQGLIEAYQERYGKDNFIKNLLLDNMLMVDILGRAKRLHIDIHARRVVFLIETDMSKDQAPLELVRSLFAVQPKNFITAVDEKNIILIKMMEENETLDDLDKTANVIVDMLNAEAMTNVHVSYGTIIEELKDVSKSYKEAKLALDVGRIFYSEKRVIAYWNLGIGRLIYQLPMNLCKMFINEVFRDVSADQFDEETLNTVNKFFECNLNVSETAREKFIHRNTLVYRLDKIQKDTGMNLRLFDDAITFKIAMMVVKYMEYLETMDY